MSLATEVRAGFSVVDITPPHGLFMAGSLDPRINEGTLDPLQARSVVLESGPRKIAIVGVDVVSLPRSVVDPIISASAAQTGIPTDAILISSSHTHNGPYTQEQNYGFDVADRAYLDRLASSVLAGIVDANAAIRPATVHVGRSLVHHGQHNRRVLNKKDQKAINTWMPAALDDLDVCPQVLGSVGPIDPELWVLRVDDRDGRPMGIFFNYSVHANARGTLLWSADYPGVVAARVRAAMGDDVVTVFAPGACGDVHPDRVGPEAWQLAADNIAEQTVAAARRARPLAGPLILGCIRRDIAVPRRDPDTQPPGAIDRLNWAGKGGRRDRFVPHLERVRAMPPELVVPISAVHIGPFAIATNPGELFVEHGLEIKARSPFPHTVVAELTNDAVGYQPTRRGFELEGYETLVGANRISPDGIETIVETATAMLDDLWHVSGRPA